MISEAVLDAEVKIGTLTAEIPKATNQYKSATDSSVASKPAIKSRTRTTQKLRLL